MKTLRISGNKNWGQVPVVKVVIALLFSLGILTVAADLTEDPSGNFPVGDLSSGRRDSIGNNYQNRLNSRMDSQFEYPVHGSRRPYDEDDESGPHNSEFSPQYPRRPDADFRDVDQQMRRKACRRQIRLENGIVQLRKQGALVRFRCRRGFSLVGPTVAVCNEGKWSEEPPICVKSGCSQPRLPFGLTGTTLFDGALWTFHCQFPGYVLVGSKLLVCNGKKWNATIPSCIPRIRLIPTTPTTTSTTTTIAAQVTELDPYDTTSTTDDLDLDRNWPTAWPTFPPIVDPTTSEPSGGQEEERKYPATVQQYDTTVSLLPKIVMTTVPTEVPEAGIVSTTNMDHALPAVTVVSPSDHERYTTAAIHNIKNVTDQESITEVHVQPVLLTTPSHPPIPAFTTVSTTHATTKINSSATPPLSISTEDAVIKVSTPTLTTLATPTTYTTTTMTTTTTSKTSRKTFATRIPFTRRTTPRRMPYSPFLPRARPWTPKPTPPPSSIEDCIRRFSGRKLQFCFNRVNILQNRNRTTRRWMKRSTYPPFVTPPTAWSDAKTFATSSSKTPAVNAATNTVPVTAQTTDLPPNPLENITMTPSTQSSAHANEADDAVEKSTNIEFIAPIHWHKIAAENIPQTKIVNPKGASSDGGSSTVKIVSLIVVIAILTVVVGIGARRYWRRHAGIVHPSPHEMDCRRLFVNRDAEDEFVYISGSSASSLT